MSGKLEMASCRYEKLGSGTFGAYFLNLAGPKYRKVFAKITSLSDAEESVRRGSYVRRKKPLLVEDARLRRRREDVADGE